MRGLWGVAVVVAGVVLLTGAQSQAQTHQINRTVPRDTETIIATHDNWKNSGTFCTSNGVPSLTLTMPPKNGTVRFGSTQTTPAGCPNAIAATGVFYRPNPGFVGQDQLAYVKPPQGGGMNVQNEGTNVISITVR